MSGYATDSGGDWLTRRPVHSNETPQTSRTQSPTTKHHNRPMGTMLRRFAICGRTFSLLTAAIGIGVFGLSGQIASGKNKKFSKRSEAAASAKKEQIRRELNTLKDHPWAGSYYYGDGLGVNIHLSLAPKSGFEFTWNGCLGLYDLNYGDVIEKHGRITLVFTHANSRRAYEGIAPELVPLVWGERHYLIPADGFIDFANAVNAGFEPSPYRSARFLLRDGDEVKSADGLPDIPAPFSEYILKRPIQAAVSSIKGSRFEDFKGNGIELSFHITTLVLNVGSEQGVKEGMEFYVYSPPNLADWAKVTKVSKDSSEAEISQDQITEKYGRPSADWLFSTSAKRD